MNESPKFILASTSPRRKEILEKMGIEFEAVASNFDENTVYEKRPEKLVKRLSFEKANSVKNDSAVVIGADTIVLKGFRRYSKPETEERAIQMLKELRGAWHTVYTGVTVNYNGKSETFAVKSKVKIKNLSDEQIQKYVAECKPLDKAGAYGIQDEAVVEEYKGSYSNIVGLPREKLAEVLQKFGVYYGVH
jgi:septum formation protein